MRKLILCGCVLLLVIGGLLVFAAYNLNDLANQNKDQLLAQAEQALGRKVQIGEIGLTFWGGIGARLRNFALADDPAFSSDNFVQAADLQVNVKLMPLLNQEIEVKRVILHDPVIRVIRNAQGIFNFASLSGGDMPDAPPDASDTTASIGSGGMPLLVALVNITNGDIQYTDQQENTALRISQLDLKVEDLSFDKPLRIELAAAIVSDQQNFQLDATFGPLGKEIQVDTLAIDGSLTLDPLDMTAVQKALPQVAEAIPPGLGISGPVRISSQLSGTARALILSGLQLTASVFESSEPNVKVTGNVGPVGTDMDALALNTDIAFGPAGLPQLLAFAPVAENLPPELSADGSASVNVHVEGTLKNLAFTATVDATQSSIQFGDQFYKAQGKRMVLSTDARMTPESIALQQAKIQLDTLELTSSGAVTLGDTLGVDLQLDSNSVDLAGWQEILPQLQDFSPTGQMELHTHVKGDVGEEQLPDITGTFDLRQVSASFAQLPQPISDLNTDITFTGQGAELKNTSARIGKSVLQLAVRIARFMPLDATYTFTSPELWLADVQASNGAEASSDVLKTLKSAGTARMENEQLAFSGTVSSAQGRLVNIDYTDFQTTLSLLNEIAKIDSVSLQTLGGSVKASGQYDMGATPPHFQVTSQISDIELGEVFRAQMINALQYVRGKANFNLDLAGGGEDWEAIKQTLQGQGKFEVNQGALVDLNIADEVLSNITGIPGLTSIVSQKVRKKYPAIWGGTDTEFADLGSQLTFREGKILLDGVYLNAVDYATRGDGWLDYDRQIDFHGQIILAQNLSKDIQDTVKVAKYISNTQGRVAIPFALSGTLPEAKPLPDIATLTRQVQQGAVQKGIEAVQKKVLDKILPSTSLLGGETDAAGESSPPKPEDLLKEGLKSLFGR